MELIRAAEFPSIYRDFVQMFPDDHACAAYLERLRWSDGFVCPACEQRGEPWRAQRGRLVCPTCRHQSTVTAGTIFDKTRTPLIHWFDAAWHITTAKNGMSAKTLERMMGISYHASSESLFPFVREMIAPGSVVCTDGWRGYYGVSKGYEHRQAILSSSDDPAHIAMPGVHQIASLLKRWLLGTHQGAFSMEHLQSYLEEFTFRFNRSTSTSRGQLFRRLLEQAVATHPVTEADILHGYQWNSEKTEN